MPKTQNKQATVSNLQLSERVTLAVCIVTIAMAFALMGVFFTLSWMFFLILIADLAVLVTGRLSDTTKQLTLFISVIGAVVALLFATASHLWIFG